VLITLFIVAVLRGLQMKAKVKKAAPVMVVPEQNGMLPQKR
jgi:hypothetical protein